VAITGAPAASVPEGTTITLGNTISDPGGSHDSFSYNWSVTGPEGFAASSPGGAIQFTPFEVGSYSVNLIVTDASGGTGTASQTITVTHVPLNPTIENDPALTKSDASVLGFLVNTTDPGADDTDLTYSWAVLDTTTSQTVATGTAATFSFSPGQDRYMVTVTVGDAGDNDSEAASTMIQIIPAGQTISIAGPTIAFALGSDVVTVSGGTNDLVALGNGNTLQANGMTNTVFDSSGANTLIGSSDPRSTNTFNAGGATSVQATGGMNTLNLTQVASNVNLDLTTTQNNSQQIDSAGLNVKGSFQNVLLGGGTNQVNASSNVSVTASNGTDSITAGNGISNVYMQAGSGSDSLVATGGNNITPGGRHRQPPVAPGHGRHQHHSDRRAG
jgi:hypothetical protein